MIPLLQSADTVILAKGAFPEHEIPLSFLKKAKRIIACDGATETLLQYGLEPDFIVGDLDSLSPSLKQQYASCLHHDPDQETNDLTKAVLFSVKNNWKDISILGATGKREDHTLGNISLLADYIHLANVRMHTDFGVFVPMISSAVFESYPGQQVSLFALTPETLFTTDKLKFSLNGRPLTSWWQGTLNEALDFSFQINIDGGKVAVFRAYCESNKC